MSKHHDNTAQRLSRKGKVDPAVGPNAAWLAISEANRIFGPQGWTRETLEMRNAANRERDGKMTSAYVARIRITILSPEGPVVRESHGCGEGKGTTPFEAHDHGIKAAELDATLRTLATFGNAFGLHRIIEAASRASKAGSDNQQTNKEDGAKRANGCSDLKDASTSMKDRVPDAEPVFKAQNTQMKGDSNLDLMLPKLSRHRSPQHLAHVRKEPCLVCGRSPVDAHHLRFVQPRAMAKKVSDEFTVPLCRRHHDLLHRDPDERAWWESVGIDPIAIAAELWEDSRTTVPVLAE